MAIGTAIFTVISPLTDKETLTFSDIIINLFKLSTGVSDYKHLYDLRLAHDIILPLYMFFIVILNVVIMNLLIAAMTDSYVNIDKKRCLLCKSARTSDAIVAEKSITLLKPYFIIPHQHQVLRIKLPDGSMWENHVFLMSTFSQDMNMQ